MTSINYSGGFAKARTSQANVPSTGQTVAMAGGDADGSLVLTPAGTLAALTVTLPPDASSVIGQTRRIITTQAITALTVNGATTIINAPASMGAGTTVTFEKIAANTWIRQ